MLIICRPEWLVLVKDVGYENFQLFHKLFFVYIYATDEFLAHF